MNTYYKFNDISSVETQQEENIGRSFHRSNTKKRLFAFLSGLITLIISQKILKVVKVSLSAVGFIGFFGVIGGIEKGSLGMISGLLLCTLITAAEFFILKNISDKEDKNK